MRAILAFHSIDDRGCVLSYAPKTLDKLLGALKRCDLPILDLDRLLKPETACGVALTFDAGQTIQKQVNELISEFYGKGIPVILLGYQLGKAQTITQLFGHWGPLYFHDSVKQMNTLHQQLGISLNDGISHSEAEKNGLLSKKPWVANKCTIFLLSSLNASTFSKI